MKKVTFIILIGICSSSLFGQDELSDKQRIEILEAKVQKLEILVSQLQSKLNNSPSVNLTKQHSKYTPVNKKGEIISYSKFEELEYKMTKAQVLSIMGEPVDVKKEQQREKVIENWYYNTAETNSRSALIFRYGTLSTINFPKKNEDYPNNN